MSSVLGIDLSSYAIDLVKLDETTNDATWRRVMLTGHNGFERTRQVPREMPAGLYYDDVYLAAIEYPTPDQQRILRLVEGAIIGCLPTRLLVYEARPSEWKAALALRGKPTLDDLDRLSPTGWSISGPLNLEDPDAQNGLDAYCIALWAREVNAQALTGPEDRRAA